MKPWPTLLSDEEAEAFVAESDLTEYDPSEMVPVRFEIRPRRADAISLPLPLLAAVREEAARLGIEPQAFVRLAVERALPSK